MQHENKLSLKQQILKGSQKPKEVSFYELRFMEHICWKTNKKKANTQIPERYTCRIIYRQ